MLEKYTEDHTKDYPSIVADFYACEKDPDLSLLIVFFGGNRITDEDRRCAAQRFGMKSKSSTVLEWMVRGWFVRDSTVPPTTIRRPI